MIRAHQMDGNTIINTVVVESLDALPNLLDAAIGGGIGDQVIDGVLHPKSKPLPAPREIELAIQATLDQFAQSWGYNDIASACTYINDPCAKFHNEAATLQSWRSKTWQVVEAANASIEAGTQPYPATIDAALAIIPQSPARPA